MTFDPATHGQRYLPEYPPLGHSDHLPMTWFALAALGAGADRCRAFAAAYLPRLAPMPAEHPHARRVIALATEIDRDGMHAVLARRLPSLASGWYRQAYHPLIRIGYGVSFDVPREVAAGLAYLEAAGPDDALARQARGLATDDRCTGEDLFRRAAALGPVPDVETTGAEAPGAAQPDSFSRRAARALADARMARVAVMPAEPLRALAQGALAVFASSHDFFALHLVTASHAFRVLEPWIGPDAHGAFTLGMLAGYRAAGAPAFEELAGDPTSATPRPEDLLALCADDEHDIKLAHAAAAHAAHWSDARYLATAEAYLRRRSRTAAT